MLMPTTHVAAACTSKSNGPSGRSSHADALTTNPPPSAANVDALPSVPAVPSITAPTEFSGIVAAAGQMNRSPPTQK